MCAEGLRCSATLQLMQAQCVSKCKKRFISRRRDARVAPACSVVTNSATVATGGALMPSCSASAADEAADVEAGAGWGGDGGEVMAGAGGGAVSFCLLCASLATVVSMCRSRVTSFSGLKSHAIVTITASFLKFSFTFGNHVFVVFASTSILGTTTRGSSKKKKGTVDSGSGSTLKVLHHIISSIMMPSSAPSARHDCSSFHLKFATFDVKKRSSIQSHCLLPCNFSTLASSSTARCELLRML